MTRKSWMLDRRTILKGAGVSLALPLLDCMGDETARTTRPTWASVTGRRKLVVEINIVMLQRAAKAADHPRMVLRELRIQIPLEEVTRQCKSSSAISVVVGEEHAKMLAKSIVTPKFRLFGLKCALMRVNCIAHM